MFQVQLSFVVNLSSVFMVQFPNFSLLLLVLLLLLLLLVGEREGGRAISHTGCRVGNSTTKLGNTNVASAVTQNPCTWTQVGWLPCLYRLHVFPAGKKKTCRSQWPSGLRCGSAAARLLRLWVRILPGAWLSVCCECCVLSGRGLCDGLITRPEESYRLWYVVVCDLET